MDQQTLLRQTVAEFFETSPDALSPEFPLSGKRLSNSLARATLDAAIRRRLGVKSPAVYSAKRFDELESAILGTEAPSVGATSRMPLSTPSASASSPYGVSSMNGDSSLNGSPGSLSCGVDIESIAALPDAEDPWEDAFYQQTFAKSEIAYCLTQEAPRQHFAARWAAKEALKKCDPAYLRAEMSDLEVVVQPDGVPSLRLRDGESSRKLPHALSLSHTDDFAVAMVVHAPAPVAPTIIRDVTPSKTEESTESQDMGDVTTNSAPASNVAPILIAMLALALAAISLIRSL